MGKKLNVYFIHAKTLKEREHVIQNVKTALKGHKFRNLSLSSFRVIDDFDPNDIDTQFIRENVSYSKIEETHVQQFNGYIKNLHINQLSNALKHRKALELIAKRSNDNEINLILEDDVLYEERFCASLDTLVSALPSSYDIVFLGMPTKTAPPKSDTYTFQDTRETFDVLPFCDSYIISHSACKALVPHYSPIKFCNNVQLSFMCYKLGLTTLQSVANIFIDGSKYGMFLSKLNTNNPLIFNNDFTTLRTIISREHMNEESKNEVLKILSTTPLKHNPDFLHLECLFHIKNKDYEKARQKFEEAYNVYAANGCTLSHDSAFLRDYIFLHKHLQKDITPSEFS